MDDKKSFGPENEGEGSKTADKQYRDAATGFAKLGGTLEKGLQAEREVEADPRDYSDAEKKGRAHSAGDLRSDMGSGARKGD